MNKLFKKSLFLAALPVGGFALFYLIPYIFVLKYSFADGEGGLGNYASVLSNEYFRMALLNTAVFIAVTIPFMLTVGYILTDMAVRHAFGSVFTVVLFLPALIPSVSAADIWTELFPGESALPIMLLFVWKNTGLVTLIMIAGRLRISREIFDAASIDGAWGLTLHRSVILPLMTPVIFFSSLVSLVQSFKIFREIYLLYDAYPPDDLYMIPHYIFNKFNKLDYGELSAGTMIFTVLILAVLAAAAVCVIGYTKGRDDYGKKS